MSSGLHVVSAGIQPTIQQFQSGEVDFLMLSWVWRLSGEKISANGGVPLYNWYPPAGYTAFLSGTANGSSAMWMKLSATGAPNVVNRASAKITTDSGKVLLEWWDMRSYTGIT